MSQVEISIPFIYIGLTAGCKTREDRVDLFNRYVQGYIERSYPELNFIEIKGMKAICEKKG